jgi:hypothetical protein
LVIDFEFKSFNPTIGLYAIVTELLENEGFDFEKELKEKIQKTEKLNIKYEIIENIF